MNRCDNLEVFLKTEIDILKKHLPEHKYLRGIQNDVDAEISFINDYGWLIKEMFCGHICSHAEDCDIAKYIKLHGDLLRDK